MIRSEGLSKKFDDDFYALREFNSEIKDGSIYGLVGSNGSGKSTLLRLISGIYYPDEGAIFIDGLAPFETPQVKERVLLVADEPYFFPGSNMNEMASYYATMYPAFDSSFYSFLCNNFPIDPARKINTFSKGMKRQVALILALASKPQYLLLDEAFDGLDPIMRGLLRKLLVDAISDRNITTIIASHNLRELEDLCDYMGLLHEGRVVFQREIDESKLGICKVQVAFTDTPSPDIFGQLTVLKMETVGSVTHLIVRGSSSEVGEYLSAYNPLFVESLPLTLEEVFIYELEAVGYDYNNIIF